MTSELEEREIQHVHVREAIRSCGSEEKLADSIEVETSINNLRVRNYVAIVPVWLRTRLEKIEAHEVYVDVCHVGDLQFCNER